jgi:hypothetical protein
MPRGAWYKHTGRRALAEAADTSPSNLRGLLRAVEQEHEAARSVEAEEQRLVRLVRASLGLPEEGPLEPAADAGGGRDGEAGDGCKVAAAAKAPAEAEAPETVAADLTYCAAAARPLPYP